MKAVRNADIKTGACLMVIAIIKITLWMLLLQQIYATLRSYEMLFSILSGRIF